MTVSALVYSGRAQDDLDEIFDFIAADNPSRARAYVEDIRKACRDLSHTPMIGMPRPDLRSGLRILPLWRRIVIAYELPPGEILILRVFSGGRDFETIMMENR